MSSSRLNRAVWVMAAALVVALPLAGCTTLKPLYGDEGLTTERIVLTYAAPANRLEQVIYQELALRLGKASANAPEVAITADSSSKTLTAGNITSPNRQRQMTVTATITLTATDGSVLFSGKRSAAADYTTNASALANQQAETEAAERAARALAETIRLTLLAALAASAQ